MSGTTAELHWFPNSKYQDRFITWGSEINLYQTNDDVTGERLQTSRISFFFRAEIRIYNIETFRSQIST